MAQGLFYSGQAMSASRMVPAGVAAPILTIPFAQITVQNSDSTPATVYADVNLSQVLPQPVIADGEGNYGFFIASGQYKQTIASAQGEALLQQAVTVSPSGPVGNPGPAGTTTYDGSSGPFNANGQLSIAPSPRSASFPSTATGQVSIDDLFFNRWKYGPGTNETGFWTNSHNLVGTTYNLTRGIKQLMALTLANYAAGDVAGQYLYIVTTTPALQNGDDEGAEGQAIYVSELQGNYTVTVTATSGFGDTAPVVSSPTGSIPYPSDQGTLLNLSKGTISGVMTARSSRLENIILSMPVTVTAGGTSLPLNTAFGTATVSLNSLFPTSLTQTATATVTLRTINGSTPPFTTGIARIADPHRTELVQITAGPVTGNTQQVTFQYRYVHQGLIYLAQGPLIGQSMIWTGDLSFHGKYLAHPVMGSLDGTHILFVEYLIGSALNNDVFPIDGIQGANPDIPSLAGFQLVPAAEITAVTTPAETIPSRFQLEANNIPFATGDSLAVSAGAWWGGDVQHLGSTVYTPMLNSFGNSGARIDSGGQGVNGAYAHFVIRANNSPLLYKFMGGPLDLPDGIVFISQQNTESFRRYIYMPHPVPPLSIDPAGAVFKIGNPNQDYTGTPYTGSTTSGSSTVTLVPRPGTFESSFGLRSGDPISGPGIPANTLLGQYNFNNGWSMVTSAGATVNATSTNTSVSGYLVQANRYALLSQPDGSSLLMDAQNRAMLFNGVVEIDGPLQANGGINLKNVISFFTGSATRVQDDSGAFHSTYTGPLSSAPVGAQVRDGKITVD